VKPNSRMQGFEGKIEDADLRAVAEYLASLK
jgi:cytochrome c553